MPRLTLLSLACWLLAGCAAGSGGHSTHPARLQRSTVTRGELAREVLLTGELVAENATELQAPNVNVWPLQIRWLIEDGSTVQPGDAIVEFDNSQLVANLEELRLSVIEAANRLATLQATAAAAEAQARFAVDQARAKLDTARIDAAIPEGMKPAREVERLHLELHRAELELADAEFKLSNQAEVSRADLDMQRVALERARAEAARAEAGATKLTVRAPRAGIVIIATNRDENRRYQSGDTIWPGWTVASLPDLSSLVVEAHLYDVDDGLVRPGMTVAATLDAFPEVSLSGHVRSVDPFAREAGRRSLRRFFRTLIDLDRVDRERMLPGMSVQVVVQPPPQRQLLLVPRDSLAWKDGAPRAVLADGRQVEVTLGPCSSTSCAVTGGLQEGVALGRAEGPP